MLPLLAVIVVEPSATAVASPEPLMVAVDCEEELQLTLLLMSFVERSPKVPVAVNCCVLAWPEELVSVIVGLAGDKLRLARSCAETKNFPQLSNIPSDASAARVPTTRSFCD